MANLYNTYWKYHKSKQLPDFKYKWPVIFNLLPKNENITILDHGCGSGYIFSRLLKLNPSSKITGVDVSEYAINLISKRFPQNNFHVVKDGEKLPIKSSSVNFIVSLDVIEHIYFTREILNEFYRILSSTGKLLITTPYNGLIKSLVISIIDFEKVFDPYGPHIRFFTKRSLSDGLERAGFEIIDSGYFGRFYPLSRGMYVLAKKKVGRFMPKKSIYK